MKIGNVFKSGKPDAENLEARAAVIHIASQLGVGQFASQLCPSCDGGASKERSLSLDVATNGVIKFYCHRAVCNFQGSCYSHSGLQVNERAPEILANVNRLNPLDADLYPLGAKDLDYFEGRYRIGRDRAGAAIRRTASRYALAIFTPAGAIRGWITRRPYGDSPADTTASRNDSQYSAKALTFMERDEPVQSWYHTQSRTGGYDKGVFLVEDQLSAMRLIEYFEAELPSDSASAVALLGTGVNASKVAEIQRQKPCRVSICLDKDATGAAFAMARKWGQAFNHTRVIVLEKDIKDCSDDEIAELPL